MNCVALISVAVGAAAAGCRSKGGCLGLARESVLLQVAHTHQGSAAASREGTCRANDHVTCPYSGVRCSGNQCCPGTVETGGKNFVCPSAASLGPWPGEIPPRCQLLTKIEDCTKAPVTHPTSNAWRVHTDSTQSGWAWDVRTLTFRDAAGEALQLGTCHAFSSGSVSDKEHGGIPGYDAENAFNGKGAWWGGRKDAHGRFFLGLRCEQQVEVAQVEIQQGDMHFAQEVVVERLDEDDNWVPLQSASGLLGGRVKGSAEDWSTESIYPNLDWVGCYADDQKRHFDAGPGGYGYSTSSCADACEGFKYMALQHKGECWCGDSLISEGQYKRADDTECGAVCVGEEQLLPMRFCGSDWRNAIYRIGGMAGTLMTPGTSSVLATTLSPSTSTDVSTTGPSTSVTMGALCKFRVSICTLPGLPFGAETTTLPPAEDWELTVDECSPDGRGGAYKVYKPSSSNPFDPECGLASPYYVEVHHYPDASCTSAKDDSGFTVFTDGQCGNCCDIRTGVCNYGCRGFLSPA
eukprot:TRINITY_DN1475_c0_g1_i2.p1 TRINITY_DN1475_c0_g1~~TRINITY_DN1475_c0_g1_i2.p1  ORF type:complete len:521 (-),score=86.46 TRINITY_DN1475_c0_g1_i2:46-1608(-)